MMSADMMPLHAQVRGGRLVLDEPVELPEGTEVDLVPVAGDDLDDEDRRRLDAAIDRGLDDARAGRTVPADVVLAALRAKRRR
jgi:predicted transcriptional regulator